MKIVFVTDLHGDIEKYEAVFDVAVDYGAFAVVNAGDMLPTSGDVLNQGDFISSYLPGHFSRYEAAGIYYICFLGNSDLEMFDPLFEETCGMFSSIVNLAQRTFEINGYVFVGMNLSVDYPYRFKDRCRKDTDDYVFERQRAKAVLSSSAGLREVDDWIAYVNTLPTLEEELNKLVRQPDMSRSIYVMHMPPVKLGFDRCRDGREAGSHAVYGFLSRNQPLLSLHGHIHESPDLTGKWIANIGRTICIQPGQVRDKLTYVTIDLETMRIDRMVSPSAGHLKH